MKKFRSYLLMTALAAFGACNDGESKADEVNTVNKKAAVETELSVQHADSVDILVTRHKIWKDHKLVKELIKRDTIPALGDTLQTVEDNHGNSRTANIKKDYEFYITVQ
ncbi:MULTISPECIES: hypothetical protein [Chryseobacterium]|uniref:hypothetical protein n=1 Tax=Chryseobacterium TaxID=59732 RepID=UPI0027D8BE97|nr:MULTISPECIES: hypothetical protein [Chryseobacterium]